MRRPGRRAGLRSAVTLAFALGALALSAVLALGTYFSARHLLSTSASAPRYARRSPMLPWSATAC